MKLLLVASRSIDCREQSHMWPSLACPVCLKLINAVSRVVSAHVTGRLGADDLIFGEDGSIFGRLVLMWASLQRVPCRLEDLELAASTADLVISIGESENDAPDIPDSAADVRIVALNRPKRASKKKTPKGRAPLAQSKGRRTRKGVKQSG